MYCPSVKSEQIFSVNAAVLNCQWSAVLSCLTALALALACLIPVGFNTTTVKNVLRSPGHLLLL